MKKCVFFTLASLLAVFLGFSAYKLGYFLAEKYFFDKIFYKKSVKHGYIDCEGGCKLERFGKRAEDVRKIYGKSLENPKQVLCKSVDDTYTVAVIGDSVTWGVRVKEDETVPALLEKKLSKLKKTKVLQLGFPGDDLLDNYIKYQLIEQAYSIDLYVFIIVQNDLLLNDYTHYDKKLRQQMILECAGSQDSITYNYNENTPGYNYAELVYKSFNNPQNLCVLKKTVALYPKDSIFLVPMGWENHNFLNPYPESLKKEGLQVLVTEQTRIYTKYREQGNHSKSYRVSEKETHPSTICHEMYTDILFEEITSNPKWRFSF